MGDRFLKAVGSLAGVHGKLFGLSDELQTFYADGYRCPKCDRRLMNRLGGITLRFYAESGERIPMWQGGVFRAAWAECPECTYKFPAKATAQVVPPATVPVIVNVVETDRVEESLGNDTKTIDNAHSSVTVKRTFSIGKEWTRSCTVEYEKITVAGSGFSLGANEMANFKATCERTLREKFSISGQAKETYSESVTIDVPAATKLRVTFLWKNVYQCGFVEVRDANGVSRVPFKAVVGVTFDQTQVDEPA